MMNKWQLLKEHVKKQISNYDKLGARGLGSLGKHIWTDVKNKMWSLDREDRK